MHYKGYIVSVTVSAIGSPSPSDVTFTIRQEDGKGPVVYEGVVHGEFDSETAAEDAAYGEARAWIEEKCKLN
jgi:hypothetical protein